MIGDTEIQEGELSDINLHHRTYHGFLRSTQKFLLTKNKSWRGSRFQQRGFPLFTVNPLTAVGNKKVTDT